ncbi:hypothetical protein JTB14_011265 [Gonioctena quinquepunctata]|nr:hypothetical protein JTB14_011265 [Gonioctena quinquepunctata]
MHLLKKLCMMINASNLGINCVKIPRSATYNVIRQRLRELGKFIMEVKKMDGSIKNLSDILVPGNYDNIVIAINKVAGSDETSGIYRAPSTAYNLGLHIKTVTTLLRSEYIKEGNSEKRTNVNDLYF